MAAKPGLNVIVVVARAKGTDQLYSELLKVPFMVRLPSGKHAVTDAVVQFPDLLPTLLELLGLPETYAYPLAGRSFARVLENPAGEHRRYAVAGYFEGADRCVRDGEWSLILRSDGRHELYNLKRDPRVNLLGERRDKAEELASALALWFAGRARPVRQVQARYELGSAGWTRLRARRLKAYL